MMKKIVLWDHGMDNHISHLFVVYFSMSFAASPLPHPISGRCHRKG